MSLPPLWEDEGGRIKHFSFVSTSRRPLEYQYFIEHLPKPPTNLFEIGCGRGEIGVPTKYHVSQITKMLVYNGYKLHGVDLHTIKWTHPNLTFTRGNFLELDLPENSFDSGLAVQVISHIGMVYFTGQNEPYDVKADYRVFEKIGRLLKPGGIFTTCLPIHNKFSIRGYVDREGVVQLPPKKGRIYSLYRIKDMTKKAGLTIDNLEIYAGWNPQLGDKPVTEMEKGSNYLALLTLRKRV